VRTARGRSVSSTRWLERQLNDPYVQAAKESGYRSRSAYKLIELNERFEFLTPGGRVVDLGAAPGGWSQVAAHRVGAEGRVVAVDLNEIEPLAGVVFLQRDALEPEALTPIREALEGRATVVMSDMAAPSTGHSQTDHLRVMGLCEAAFDIAEELLAPEGAFLCKVLRGGAEQTLLARLKIAFKTVKHVKPKASRADSAEVYLVALGFRGNKEDT
jgi:23S rRNA (uridine2552-2'-O)-methyltransferase